MSPKSESANLADGTTVFSMPAGLKWIARHDPAGFLPGQRFIDEVTSEPFRRITGWKHTHVLSDTPLDDGSAGTVLEDTVDTKVPVPGLDSMFAYRATKVAGDLAAVDRLSEYLGHVPEPLTVAISGATGTVGTQLRALLTTAGHEVILLVRSREQTGVDKRYWDTAAPAADLLGGVDAVIHLAGAPIAGRFTEAHLRKVRHSRVEPTRALAKLVASTDSVKVAVGASAVGFYGADRGPEVLTEDAGPGAEAQRYDGSAAADSLSAIVRDWENAWDPARDAGKRVVNVRTGLVLAGGGGLLPLLAGVVFTGLGGRLGSGEQWFPWIALDDLLDIYHRSLADSGLAGPVNAVVPLAFGVNNAEFTRVLGEVLHRPTAVPIPSLGPAVLLGKRGAAELALANQRVEAAALQKAGHRFRFTSLNDALRHELLKER